MREDHTAANDPSQILLQVDGMTCAACSARVERALSKVPGVQTASVNLLTGRAEVLGAKLDRAGLVKAVGDAGYDVTVSTREIAVEGMTCASCVARVERALARVPGVQSASVNLATEKASVFGSADPADLIAAVEAAGYGAHLAQRGVADEAATAARRQEETAAQKRNLLLAAILILPIFALEMGAHLFDSFHHLVMTTIGEQGSRLVQFALTTLVLLGPGRGFYRLGIPALLRGGPDMNSLVAVGTGAAFGYSVVATFAPTLLPEGTEHVYYEAAAVIVGLVLLGRFLEAQARGQSSAAIRRLIGLQPRTARVLREGLVAEIPVTELNPGDVVELRPGERVPTDGEMVEGKSWIDESMITGEPLPVQKQIGAKVTGGTVNQAGGLRFRATAVGEATMLAQIIRMVETAQGGKLPVQALVDRVTLWFVPVVMGLSALTFATWMIFGPTPALGLALVNAVTVLIIACPCAMGLATPTSILVGTGRGAEMGILFRKGDALQALQGVKVVALDKTGTLTEGHPALSDLILVPGVARGPLLAAVAAVEARSEHPIARAIVQAAEAEGLSLPDVTDFHSLTGLGVRAMAGGVEVALGSDRYMAELGLDLAPFAADAARLGDEGKTPLYAAQGGKLAAILAVSDPLKPTTPAAIAALKALGLHVALITGDNRRTAMAIAGKLGIDEVQAEVLPAGKVAALQSLRAFGPVAFVGDGINDAPALAEADVGIAIGTGTEIAIESAEVVLVAGRLSSVPEAIALSRVVMRNIRQNLFWAFAYNALLIPVAAGALWPAYGLLLSPILGAGAMSLSSIFVIGNALRLGRFGRAGSALA